MKLLGIFLTACVVLAAAQAAAAALAALLLCGIIYGLFACPRELFGLLALCIVAGVIERHPLPCLGLIVLVAVTGTMRKL